MGAPGGRIGAQLPRRRSRPRRYETALRERVAPVAPKAPLTSRVPSQLLRKHPAGGASQIRTAADEGAGQQRQTSGPAQTQQVNRSHISAVGFWAVAPPRSLKAAFSLTRDTVGVSRRKSCCRGVTSRSTSQHAERDTPKGRLFNGGGRLAEPGDESEVPAGSNPFATWRRRVLMELLRRIFIDPIIRLFLRLMTWGRW